VNPVIAVDTNILVYALRADAQNHPAARSALSALIQSDDSWAITWPSVHEFIAVVTNPRLFKEAETVASALSQISGLVTEGAQLLSESARHLQTLREVGSAAGIRGGAIHDARIAAICIDHGVSELWTADRDFTRFPRLKIRNPLA
jgi:toxin-antitoxin system PIN domain toxin